ncbi:MAG: nucleoside diphosphate kinase regulator [Kiritimatiellae bacterium]|nr:nucleoside diphosphate kinase regulator [Kiritimatiellia bacterium]MDD5521192.1 nucleoside diphosphate kinase regulator [Kiritimatiellia bacterium]
MKPRKICITEADKMHLEELIDVAGEFGGRARKDLEALAHELARADIVDPKDVRPDVVTMNSRVVLKDVNTGEEMNYALVFPKDANVDEGAISVLAPIGTAILGYSKGDIIEWPVPAGMRRIRIEKIVYQPEAAGHFHL